MSGPGETNRRNLLRWAGAGAIAFTLDGAEVLLRPGEARAQGLPFTALTAEEVDTLEAFGEALHPGAREAGIAHFVDRQLSVSVADSLLIARHFLEAPYLGFYRAGLAALEAAARTAHGVGFAALPAEAASALVADLRDDHISDWAGPPATLLYLVVRGDAVDVVYSTMADYQRLLDIPYLPHILPPEPW